MSKYRLTSEDIESVGQVARIALAWVDSAQVVASTMGVHPDSPTGMVLDDLRATCEGVLSMVEVADRVTVRLPE